MGAAVNMALPQIGEEFRMNAVELSWVSMAFLLSSAIFLVPVGKIADIIGRKKIFLIGTIIYSISSLLCVFSFSTLSLIFFRLIQGIGSSMVFSTGMAILISSYPPNQRGKVIGLTVSSVYIGLTAAPVLGGILTQTIGWRSLFYINAGAGIFTILATIFKIKAEWIEAKNEPFDYKGSLIYVIAMSAMMYGFSQLPKNFAIVLVVIGIYGFIYFLFVESKVEFPVLNIKLFRYNRIFAFSNLAALINYAATFGITFLLSLYFQYAKGMKPAQAGAVLFIQPMVMAVIAFLAGKFSDKYDSRILSSAGMLIIVVGLIFLIFLNIETSNTYIIFSLIILGFGFGLFSAPNTNSVMCSVEKQHLGTASATIGTMRLTGQMLSMAIAAMVIHVFVGDKAISKSNINPFITSIKIVFIIFTVLCILGVFASLARGKEIKKI